MLRTSALLLIVWLAQLTSATSCYAQGAPSLMTMIAQWQYPDSKINGGTMNDAATQNSTGERTLQSIQYKTVLTTKDSMQKVIEYYKSKLMPPAISKAARPQVSPT